MGKTFKRFGVVILAASLLTACNSDEVTTQAATGEAELIGFVNEEGQQRDIFFMYTNTDGAYFIEPTAQYENVIFVDNAFLTDWGISRDTEHGSKYVGQFDADGWELLGIVGEDSIGIE